MPGIYGSKNFIVGEPSTPKTVHSGACVVCGKTVYRQTYLTDSQEWVWRCYGCDPYQPVMERRYRGQTMDPMGYVPRNYDIQQEKSTKFDPALAQAIRRSRERD